MAFASAAGVAAAAFYSWRATKISDIPAGTSAGFWIGGQCPLAA